MTATSAVFLVAGLLVAAAYFIWRDRPVGFARSAIKTAPLLFFSVSAISAGAPPFLSMALILSALGDLALSRRGASAFLYGLAAFALAHVFYAMVFLSLSAAHLWDSFNAHPLAALAMVATAVSTEVWLTPHVAQLRWPVRAYVLVITAMMLAALTLPATAFAAVLGAVCFVGSDLILSIEQFRLTPGSRLAARASAVVWALYIAGQGLILWGVLQA